MLNVATLMKVYPGMEIEVRGHTDASNGTKDPNYNQKLSEKGRKLLKIIFNLNTIFHQIEYNQKAMVI